MLPSFPTEGLFTVSGSTEFFPSLVLALEKARTSIAPTSIYHMTQEVLTREHGEITSHRVSTQTVAFLAGRSP